MVTLMPRHTKCCHMSCVVFPLARIARICWEVCLSMRVIVVAASVSSRKILNMVRLVQALLYLEEQERRDADVMEVNSGKWGGRRIGSPV